MEVILIESQAYYKLLEESVRRIDAIRTLQAQQSPAEKEWLTLREAQQLLPLKSKSSWQKLRDTGKVTFSKTNNIILYSRKSVLNLIERNRI